MLDLARRLLGPLQQRVELHRGYIDTAPRDHTTRNPAAALSIA